MNADYTVIDCNPHRGISLTGMSLCLLMLCFLWVFPCIWKEFKAEVKITENCLIILAHSAIRKGMGNGFLWIPRLFNHFIPLTVLWSEGVIKKKPARTSTVPRISLPPSFTAVVLLRLFEISNKFPHGTRVSEILTIYVTRKIVQLFHKLAPKHITWRVVGIQLYLVLHGCSEGM